jgi:Rad51
LITELLTPLVAKMVEEPFKLLIMDSITANLRVDFSGRGELAERCGAIPANLILHYYNAYKIEIIYTWNCRSLEDDTGLIRALLQAAEARAADEQAEEGMPQLRKLALVVTQSSSQGCNVPLFHFTILRVRR